MMMTREEAIAAADRAADLVWLCARGPAAFGWRTAFRNGLGRGALAQWVAGHREQPARALYEFAVAGDDAAAWADLPPPLRAALEVFRATFLVLLAEIEAAAPKPADAPFTPVRAVPAAPPPQPKLTDAGLDRAVVRLEQQWADDDGRPRRKGKSP